MRRRDFITLIGAAAALSVWPLAARAQVPGKVPTIGFLGPLSQSAQSTWTAAFAPLRLRGLFSGRRSPCVRGRVCAIHRADACRAPSRMLRASVY
jgi:hypothetical protein